jgi:hypothetical protein
MDGIGTRICTELFLETSRRCCCILLRETFKYLLKRVKAHACGARDCACTCDQPPYESKVSIVFALNQGNEAMLIDAG